MEVFCIFSFFCVFFKKKLNFNKKIDTTKNFVKNAQFFFIQKFENIVHFLQHL